MEKDLTLERLTDVVSTRAVALSLIVEPIEFEEERDIADDSPSTAQGLSDEVEEGLHGVDFQMTLKPQSPKALGFRDDVGVGDVSLLARELGVELRSELVVCFLIVSTVRFTLLAELFYADIGMSLFFCVGADEVLIEGL